MRSAVVVVLAGLVLAACGGSPEPDARASDGPASSTPSADSATYPYDTSTSGDDLLQDARVEHAFGAAAISWQFPTSYAEGETDAASSTVEVDGTRYGLQVVAAADGTPRSKAEQLVSATGNDQASISEVRLGNRDWTAVVDDGGPVRRVVLLGTADGVSVVGAILTSTAPLADLPPERVAELHQTVLSIRPAGG